MKILEKQRNSKDCLICGMDNPYGVKAQFYSLENKMVGSIFEYDYKHQSYPTRVHGGMITAMLDELGCRAYWAYQEPYSSAVTMSLETKYRKPVPYNETLKGIGKIIKDNPRYFDAECAIYDLKGIVLASASMRYIKMPLEKVCDSSFEEEMPYDIKDNVKDFIVPGVLE